MPATFELKVRGMVELQRAYKKYPQISEPILQKAMDATGAVFAKHTHKKDPVPFDTGNLLQSFRFKSSRLKATWRPTAHYAPFVELGTRPHIILPKRKKALRWQTGGGGKYVTSASGKRRYQSTSANYRFAQREQHPGTKAQPFMEKIVKKSDDDVTKLFGEAGDLINKAIARKAL